MSHRVIALGFIALALCLSLAATLRAQEQNPPGRLLDGHKGSVVSVAFTRDGNLEIEDWIFPGA